MVPAASDVERRAQVMNEFEKTSVERRASSPVEGKRMLALFQISEADDLGMALGRLFLPGNPLLAKLNSGRCFTRYAVVEDESQRSTAYAIFQHWMRESAETASGISSCGAEPALSAQPQEGSRMGDSVREVVEQQSCGSDIPVRAETNKDAGLDSDVEQVVPPSISSAWGVGFTEVQNREAKGAILRPQPLPSGF